MSAAIANGRGGDHRWLDRAWTGLLWGLMTLFLVNIGLMIAAVATNSFAKRWLGTWLPDGWTTDWYVSAWKEFQLDAILIVTVEVVFAVVFLAQCLFIGLFLAILLDQRIKGESFFRTVYVLPFAISAIVTGVAWKWLMNPAAGLNAIFDSVGLDFLQNKWFAEPNIGIIAIAIAAAWTMSGYTMALYLAGLRGVPSELRDASRIDGASGFQYYRHIAIPLVTPVTFTALIILGTITLRLFDLVAAMTGGGPAFATDTPAFFMFQTTFQQYRYSQGAAIGVVMLILALGLIVPYFFTIKDEIEQ